MKQLQASGVYLETLQANDDIYKHFHYSSKHSNSIWENSVPPFMQLVFKGTGECAMYNLELCPHIVLLTISTTVFHKQRLIWALKKGPHRVIAR